MLAFQLRDTEFNAVAVSVALWLLVILPATAANVVEVAPAGTITEFAETGNNVLLLDNNTSIPPVGAAEFRLTAQVVVPPELKLLGLQANFITGSTCPMAVLAQKQASIPNRTLLPMRRLLIIILSEVLN